MGAATGLSYGENSQMNARKHGAWAALRCGLLFRFAKSIGIVLSHMIVLVNHHLSVVRNEQNDCA